MNKLAWFAGTFALGMATVLAGCDAGSSGSLDGGADGPPACAAGDAGATGMLSIVLTTPAGVTGVARVRGPGSYSTELTSSQTLTLPAGSGYVVEARRVKTAPATGGIVGKAYSPSLTAFTGCVAAGMTATVTVTYTLEPGSEKMWMTLANAASEVAAYDNTQLASSGMKEPAVTKTKNITSGHDIAIDALGNLWVADSQQIHMYKMETLGTSGDRAPDVVLTPPFGGGAPGAVSLAFDGVGNLWVGHLQRDEIFRFTPEQLTTTGAPALGVSIKSPDIEAPAALAFDSLSHLWVASAGNSKVVRIDAARLLATYNGPADKVITGHLGFNSDGSSKGTLTDPQGLAIDRAGNVWVAYFAPGIAARYTPTEQSTAGSLAPGVQITVAVTALLEGLAFDDTGGLWMPGSQGKVIRVPAARLSVSAEVMPDIIIESPNLGTVSKLAFDPAPIGLPLRN